MDSQYKEIDLKVVFLKAYANLPLGLRGEIVIVLDNEPMTWNAVKIEIDNNTEKGTRILEKLVELGILKNE